MPWRTVKSTSQSWCAHTHPGNPSVFCPLVSNHPSFLSSLSLLQWWGQRKALNHLPTRPPPSYSLGLFRQGSQAWLAIVTWPHGGKIGTNVQTHTHTRTSTHAHKFMCQHTNVEKRRTRASFARSDYPLSKAQRGGQKEVENFAIFNVSHHPQDTNIHLQRLERLEEKELCCFLVLATKFSKSTGYCYEAKNERSINEKRNSITMKTVID